MMEDEMYKAGMIRPDYKEMEREERNFTIVVLILFSLVLCTYSAYRITQIYPIYLDADVRTNVLNAIFYVRETQGISIADLSVGKVTNDTIVIKEQYHGLVNNIKRDRFYKVELS
jgi:hypothetical protein